MSIQNDKLMNLQDGQVLYNDLRDRIEDTKLNATLSTPTPIVSFPDGAPYPMSLTAEINPVQDLHGYDHPWPAGGGKNLCSCETISLVKPDTRVARVTLGTPIPPGSYTVTITQSGTSTHTGVVFRKGIEVQEDQITITVSSNGTTSYSLNSSITITHIYAFIANTQEDGTTANLTNIMICKSTETDPTTFEPYSNVCPISGFDGANVMVTGKNVIPDGHNTSNGYVYNYFLNNDNTTSSGNYWYVSEYFRIQANQKYTISRVAGGVVLPAVCFYDRNKNFISGRTIGLQQPGSVIISTPEGAYYCRCSQRPEEYGILQMELGETATELVPYSQSACPITFPTSAGTVYGGTLTVNPDGTGKLVVNMLQYTFNGTENITVNADRFLYNHGKREASTTNNHMNIIACSHYMPDTNSNVYAKRTDATYQGICAYGGGLIWNDNVNFLTNDTTAYKTYLANQYANGTPLSVVWKIVTPYEYTLTPGQVLSLLGQNNIWVDTGDIQSLSYVRKTVPELIRQDVAGQISERITPIESSLAIVVDGDTAPKNITSGQYVYVKNHSTLATGMYHATAAIASGTSISNSNVVIDSNGIGNALLSLMFVRKTTTWGKTLTFTGSSSMTQGILLINYTPVFVWMPSTVDIDIAWLDLANSVIRCKESHTGTITFSPTSISGTEYTITRTSGTGSFTLTKNGTDSASFTYFGF